MVQGFGFIFSFCCLQGALRLLRLNFGVGVRVREHQRVKLSTPKPGPQLYVAHKC